MKKLVLLVAGLLVVAIAAWLLLDVEYVRTSKREIPPMSPALKQEWLTYLENEKPNSSEDIMAASNKWVAGKLEYDYGVSSFDPNDAVRKGKVNCAGYAALQTAALNEVFQGTEYHAEWHFGKVQFNGINAEHFRAVLVFLGAESRAWNWKGGHCYTVVYNKKTNARMFPDASYYDLIGIGYLASSER